MIWVTMLARKPTIQAAGYPTAYRTIFGLHPRLNCNGFLMQCFGLTLVFIA